MPNEQPLAEVYLYEAIIKATVGDVFPDWAFSDKQEVGEFIGEENMVQLYDQALEYVNKGLALDADFETELVAMKARVLFSRSASDKMHPAGGVDTDNPLVNNPEAADAALDLMSNADIIYELPVASDGGFNSDVAFQINERNELLPDTSVYIDPSPTKYRGNLGESVHLTMVSAREMPLIIAENALADGDKGPGPSSVEADQPVSPGPSPDRHVSIWYIVAPVAAQLGCRCDPGTFILLTNTEVRSNPSL